MTPFARRSFSTRALQGQHTRDSRAAPRGLWHHSPVSKGRLTRQELGWLLTQEAQGAAERLRRGVQVLKTKPPPPPSQPPEEEPSSPPSQPALGVEASLAALDDVMQMLSSLHAKPAAGRGRRGRIDIASLIWEVAPEARVAIEPGSGTEVFCDEGEIRRMLHVLLGHGSGLGSSVTIKRDGDEVRVAVALGPDSSATAETERAWLSRMAIRYGGRYELEGGLESLTLPAGDASARDENDALRKELDEARKQGEAYARELAAVFAQGEELASAASQSSFPPAVSLAPSEERFAVLSRFASGIAAELRALLTPLGREIQALKSQQTSAPPGMSSRPPRRSQARSPRIASRRCAGACLPCRTSSPRSPRSASSTPRSHTPRSTSRTSRGRRSAGSLLASSDRTLTSISRFRRSGRSPRSLRARLLCFCERSLRRPSRPRPREAA